MSSSPPSVFTAHSAHKTASAVVRELSHDLGDATPGVVVFFCAHTHDGAAISAGLRARWPETPVVGCTSAGEYSDAVYGRGGVAAMAIPTPKLGARAATIARFEAGVAAGITDACARLSEALGTPLRELDPKRYVGVVLIEGSKGNEEAVNEALGNAAPFLSFVGGSAGDDIAFARTEVFHDGEASDDGAVLLVMEMHTPFAVVKTCNYAPTDMSVTITKLGAHPRVVLEIDDKPARNVYADLLGVEPNILSHAHFLTRPLGLMIEDKPWLRSVLALPDEPGSLMMACELVEGMELSLMQPLDIIQDTLTAIDRAQKTMDCPIAGAIHFDCAYRRLELEARELQQDYHRAIARQPLLGLHTHGESWLGHINQTLTSLVFG